MATAPARTLVRVALAARVVHPLPSTLNALVVAALAAVADADVMVATRLAVAMFAFQASIGAINDVIDADRDRVGKPRKPIPAGNIDPAAAALVGVGAGAVGLILSAASGLPVLVLGAAGLATGLAYDLRLRDSGLGWVCYALAFPLLLIWTWWAAAGTLPPGWPLLLPLATVAGPVIHLANSLVDVESDRSVGVPTLATRLGHRRGLVVLTAISATIWVAGWVALVAVGAPPESLAIAAGATVLAWLGVAGLWRASPAIREASWISQAAALGLLAVAWVITAS
jgi:geranylgeranylglycerol-phosphate geranylgeranyltransferase